ncbi:DUF2637 domain-containing protein [Streptomyces sp. TRM66268-LWL]|uniref:DUF2637 domain-containing protein n=1 Tax=Streptomyces polyasparticus TaxID=2767826 RepID=A0ABR7ST60_9ACTN|nr:DUF2637 domain-containing protein [Streptomyces polyasparticus]MBC9718685.1 DUF2637 domain-containing protein [Streptomyces polyasparticus]
MAAPLKLTRTHRILIGVVVAGAVIIAAIGFAGSYAAVRELAEDKGFGKFSLVFPIGIDAGICVLLALDLLLTWIRIPFPLLRQTAWVLTAATIAFNGAAAWPDPLGTAMHAVIPVLFVISVEAARHAIGRIADITADKHMEGVRLTRWLLSPVPTFLLWRRMKLWELRSYDAVIKLEQERLVYRARLRSRYGRAWRRKAPVESLMPLRLARYGVPLAETAPAGLAAAGIEAPQLPASTPQLEAPGSVKDAPGAEQPVEIPQEWPTNHDSPWFATPQQPQQLQAGQPGRPPYETYEQQAYEQQPYGQQAHAYAEQAGQPGQPGQPQQYERTYSPEPPYEEWYEEQPAEAFDSSQTGEFRIPAGPNRTRALNIPGQRQEQQAEEPAESLGADATDEEEAPAPAGLPDDVTREEAYFTAFRKYVSEHGDFPNARQFGIYLQDLYGVKGRSGGPLTESTLRPFIRDFRARYQQELDSEEYIA